jgi:peptidyl-prolyl cis-trans isomerase C
MRLFREPLLHFVVLGGLLFAAEAVLRQKAEPSPQVILIAATEIDRLEAQWERLYRRSPSPLELQGLIDAQVKEEVLVREALAMGLDREDTIVRRRLAQKLEFLINDVAGGREPSAVELAAFFRARQEGYRAPSLVSFAQIYFSRERRAATARDDAEAVLARLAEGVPADAAAMAGDGFLPGAAFAEQRPADVAAIFGPDFAAAVERLPVGSWQGPIASAYGWHLVRLEARLDPPPPTLSTVAARVRDDWLAEQRRLANEAVLAQLRERYAVTIEDRPTDAAIAVSTAELGQRP